MSEQATFTYHEPSEPVRSSDALLYEATERPTMPHETNTTPEQQAAPGTWELPYVTAATAQLGYFRLMKLAESGNPEAQQALAQGMAAQAKQLTQADVDPAA